MPKFQDIPKFYKCNYVVDCSWNFLERQLESYREYYGLDLDPPYQRGHVWSMEQRIAYVEYILADGPSSRELKFNCPGFDTKVKAGPMELVDGKQRLTSVLMFMNNELPAYGHLLKEYEDKPSWHAQSFKVHVNNLSTRKEVLIWYLQLNAGGVVHTKEEIDKVRNMLNEEEEMT
jgi:hypothetical protein